MFDFGHVVRVLGEELGEAGFDAFVDAVEFYLGQAKFSVFGCEEDKLILLMFLYSCPRSLIYEDFDPLRHFGINFNCKEI